MESVALAGCEKQTRADESFWFQWPPLGQHLIIRVESKTWVNTRKQRQLTVTQSPPSLTTTSATAKLTMCLTTRKIDILLNAWKKFMWKQNCAITTICRAARASEFKRDGKRKPASYPRGVEHGPAMLVGGGRETSSLSSDDVLARPSSASIHSSPLQLLMSPVTLTVLIFIKSFFSSKLPSVWYRDMCKINDVYSCRGSLPPPELP